MLPQFTDVLEGKRDKEAFVPISSAGFGWIADCWEENESAVRSLQESEIHNHHSSIFQRKSRTGFPVRLLIDWIRGRDAHAP
jgi:hypothetical protein